MKNSVTYQTSEFPIGMYPYAADADYGKGRGVFKLEFEEEG